MAKATRLLIKNGTLIDGSGGDPVPNRLLVVEGNRITLVGGRDADRRLARWREMDSNHRSPARKSRFLLRKANCGTERGQPKRVVSF
jgi:hypothetical protein